MMNMNSALLSISAALFWSLFLSDAGHATQTERRQAPPNVMTAEMSGSVNAPATPISNTPTPCAMTGKGRTRALCENHSLFRSGERTTVASQYLSTVIVTAVSVMLIVLTVAAWLSLALVAVAAWARRIRRQPVERAEVHLSALSVQQPWHKTTASSAAFRLVWFLWLVWFF